MLIGLLKQQKDGSWICKFPVKDGHFNYKMEMLPLHPDDYTLAEEGKFMHFEIENTTAGTSEFDVIDCDMVRIKKT